jgi:hypothetical protein
MRSEDGNMENILLCELRMAKSGRDKGKEEGEGADRGYKRNKGK